MRGLRTNATVKLILVALMLVVAPLLMADDWPTYMHDPSRSGASQDTTLSAANVPQLVKLWSYATGGVIASQPIIVNGVVYVGSWDGYEYALNTSTGALQWKTFIGQTVDATCGTTTGVTSAATVQNGVVYVGGGDAYWYALDSSTGAILWKVYTGDNSASSGHYNWSSPLIYNGYAYIGIASNCDTPLVQGQLLQVSLSTHQVVNTLNLVPNGQIGGGLWTSPTIDTSTNTIYLTTGTEGQDPSTLQPYTLAMVAVDASTLAIKSSWQIPQSQQGGDSDWGNTPVIFSDANGRQLVAAVNKNGYLYAFDRTNISAGPVWQQDMVVPGPCPNCGDGTASSGAFGAGRLYMAGGNTTINGMSCQGTIQAFDPTTGNVLWQHCAPAMVVSSIVYANGMVIAAGGDYGAPDDYIEVLDAGTGARLYSYTAGTAFYSLSMANGQIYAGGTDFKVYALGLPSVSPSPTPTPVADPNCPSGWSCQDVGGPTPSGSESVGGPTYTVSAGGTDIGGTSDQFRYVAQSVSGDTQITAQVASQTSSSASAKAGLMVRQSMDPTAPYYAAFLTPGNGLVVQYRLQAGGVTSTAITNFTTAAPPLYLKIQRRGDGFVTATSSDGSSYTLVPGSQTTVVLTTAGLSGLAVTSHDSTQTNTAQFNNVTVGPPGAAPTAPAPPADPACPSAWTCQDIGSFVPTGNESVTNGAWTVQAAGQGVTGAYDQFRYMWQPLTGDGTINAHITSITNPSSGARAGVMIRQSADPAAPFYAVYVTPGKGVIVQYRLTQGGFTRTAASISGTAPVYLQVVRLANAFTAYTSADGTNWSPIAQDIPAISMSSSVLAGLAVTSVSPGNFVTAQLDTVNVKSSAGINATCAGSTTSSATLAARYCSGPPTLWPAGLTQTFTVTITNTGTQTWSASGTNPVHFGVEFGTADDTPGVGWTSDQRFSLSNDVAPGASVTLSVGVAAPTTGGSYVLHERMVQENVAWFSQVQDTSVTVGTLAAGYSSSPPTTWAPGQSQTYNMTATNNGTLPWTAFPPNQMRLGVAFGTSDDTPGVGWATDQRFAVPSDVQPGASTTFSVTPTAPTNLGSYVLHQRIVEEGISWFSQVQDTSVTVANPTPTSTPTNTPTATPTATNTPTATPTATATSTPTAALAAGYASSPPTLWPVGLTQSFSVTITNTGTQTWNATGTNPFHFGVEFGTSSDVPSTGWATDQRFNLPNDVAPGGSVTMTVNVTAPTTGGSYVLHERMVEENVAWFSQVQDTSVTVGTLAASYSSTPPTSWPIGVTQTYSITITNTGTLAWNATGTNPVHFGVEFGTSDDTPGSGWANDLRFNLPNDVQPGSSVTLSVAVTPPWTGGSYVLHQRMIKENLAWFSQVQDTSVSVGTLSASYSSSPQTIWPTGVAQTYSITLTNTGTLTWNASGTNPVRLGVEFGTSSDAPHVGWATDQRLSLPSNVAPGASVTFNVSVTPPATGGSYVLHNHLVNENVTWFNQVQDTSVTVGTLSASFSSTPLTLWPVGLTQSYAITVTNTGTLTWNAAGTNPVHLGVEFGTSSDAPGVGWATDQRFTLPNDVAPGASVTMTVKVVAPTTGGTYVLHHHMVKENVTWFGQVQDTNVTVGTLAASYSSSPPTQWKSGQAQSYSVTITNTGTLPWNATGANPVHFGVEFGSSSDTPLTGWVTDQRFSLPSDVQPGASVTLSVNVTAPTTKGGYTLHQRMLKENVAWFNQVQDTSVTVS